MIISVLKDYYPEEYEMLSLLANDDIETFTEFAELHPSYTAHLLGYGLIKKERCGFDFNIDSVREYILDQSKFKKIGLTNEEMWAEISKRRNSAEINLRKLIRLTLRNRLGLQKAKELILDIFGGKRKEKLSNLSYDDLFNAAKGEIYFSDLSKIISKKWAFFSNSFEKTKQDTFKELEFINSSRADAHAKELTKEQFSYFRLCMTNLENDLENAT